MSRIYGVGLRVWMLAAMLATSSTAMSVRPNPLFERDGTCKDPNSTKCPQAGLPNDFCCTEGTTCIPLAGNTTVLCCPDGPDGCGVIAAIVCDLNLQDASQNPGAVVKTTALRSKLPTCGANCCPFGYTCNGDENCKMDDDQSKAPKSADPSTTDTAKTTGGSSAATSASGADKSSAAASATGSESESGTAAPPVHDDSIAGPTSTGAVVGGVVGGIIGIAVIASVILCLRNRRKNNRRPSEPLGRGSNFPPTRTASKGAKPQISNPIPLPEHPIERNDFQARHGPSRGPSPAPSQDRGFESDQFEFDDKFVSYNADEKYAAYNPADTRGISYNSAYTSGVSNIDTRSFHQSAEINPLGAPQLPPLHNVDTGRDLVHVHQKRPSSGQSKYPFLLRATVKEPVQVSEYDSSGMYRVDDEPRSQPGLHAPTLAEQDRGTVWGDLMFQASRPK